MPLNWPWWRSTGFGGSAPAARGQWLVGNIIKFPNDGRIVRFGRANAAESATVIILPVVRIERYPAETMDDAEPRSQPPTGNGGRRRVRRR
jgi:hypothetical protein